MSNKKIRVPATTVQLIQILGTILREHIKLRPLDTECWTFEHVAKWGIYGKKPGPEAGLVEWSEYQLYENPVHAMQTYLGYGHYIEEEGKRLDLRVRCEHTTWVGASLRDWHFQIWIKFPGGSTKQYHYRCDLGYGDSRDISPVEDSQMPHDPPRKIAFWRRQEEMETSAE